MSSATLKNLEPFVSEQTRLLDHHPLPSWIIVSNTLQIKFANQAAVNYSGYSSEEQLQHHFTYLFARESSSLLKDRSSRQQPLKGNYLLAVKEGTFMRVELFDSSFTIDETIYAQITIVPLINGYKMDKADLFNLIVEQTTDILTVSDMNFRPITWNKASEQIFGLQAEQVLGKDLRQFMDIRYTGSTKEEVRDLLNKSGEWTGEASFSLLNSSRQVIVLITFKLLKDQDHNPLGYLISAKDITERKEVERKLKESESRFREMADSAPVKIWISDLENKVTYVNKPWVSYTGVDLAEIKNGGWVNLVHPDDIKAAKKKFDRHFLSRIPVTIVYRLKQHDGKFRWVQEAAIPRILSDGTFIGFIGTVVDIHDQKLKEEQLSYQASILENVSDIIVATDKDFTIHIWNKAAAHYYGIEEIDAVGKKMGDLIKFTYYNSSEQELITSLQQTGFWKGEKSFVNAGGEVKYFLNSIKHIYDPLTNEVTVLSVGRDITERRRAEEKILQSEQFYRTLIADSSNGTLLSDASGNITFTSHSVKYILGYEDNEVLGRNLFEFVHPDDQAWAAQSFQRELIEKPEVKSIVVRLLKKNGEWLWCMVRGHNLLNNTYIKSFVVYFHDDTLRKKANDALKESEKRFRSLIRDIQIGVVLQDKEGKIVLCNDAIANILMTGIDDLMGKKIYEIAGDAVREDGTKYELEDRPAFKSLQTKKVIRDAVLGIYRPAVKDRVWVIINSDPVLDEKGEVLHIVSSIKDITERKKLEEDLMAKQISHQRQLTQATIDGQEKERTEIGKELHDNIGQQLTTIKLFLDLAKGTADDTTLEMLNMSLKGVADVINDVRSMSRSLVPSTLKDLGLIESVNELADSIKRTQMLLVNMGIKGFKEDQLPENQKLTIFRIIQEQLNNIVRHAGAKNVWINLQNKAGGVILEVKDDGKGFDMKKVRKGLGFVNIRNRAGLFGGSVLIDTKPSKGCLLRVSFPPQS